MHQKNLRPTNPTTEEAELRYRQRSSIRFKKKPKSPGGMLEVFGDTECLLPGREFSV